MAGLLLSQDMIRTAAVFTRYNRRSDSPKTTAQSLDTKNLKESDLSTIRIPAVALLMTIVLTVAWRLLSFDVIEDNASLIVISYILLSCLAFPLRYGIWFIFTLCLFYLTLAKINEIKIALTELPLTYMDLAIAVSNPEGFLSAIRLSHSLVYIFYFLVALFAVVLLGLIGRAAFQIFTTDIPRGELVIRATTVLVALAALWNFTGYFVTREQTTVAAEDTDRTLWRLEGVTKLSRKIGLLPFLAFSYSISHANTGDYFNYQRGNRLPNAHAILDAVTYYVRPKATSREEIPNIVVLMAESTFNLNSVLRLTKPVKNAIYSKNIYTQALGNLRVNAIGGGTWITEFETLAGLDSRLFGYSGYYTHSSLAPFISSTFVTYLNLRGYNTYTFYGSTGKFYNARNAYKAYGVRKFYDNIDLGRSKWSRSDLEIVKDSMNVLGPNPAAPFYAFIVTNQNHAPHPCRHFENEQQFVSSLRENSKFAINCELNEYILRLNDTSSAFETILNYLKEVEINTSRPFVLLLVGDHQPHTFTQDVAVDTTPTPSTLRSPHDYSPYRMGSKSETIFHLASSKRGIVNCCEGDPPPASLMPSLLSAFVASAPSDVYLGVNFLLYRHCGSDFLAGAESHGLRGGTRPRDSRAPECEEAYEGALAFYRQFGPFSKHTSAAR